MDENIKVIMENLLIKFGGIGIDKQFILSKKLIEDDWSYLPDEGILKFENNMKYKVQVLGTQSNVSKTWLWSWANDDFQANKESLNAVKKIKEYGEKNNIDILTEEEIEISDDLNDFLIAVVSSGIYDSKGFYIGKLELGSIVFLIDDEKVKMETETEVGKRLSTVLMNLISYLKRDHNKAFESYLNFLKVKYIKEDNKIIIKHDEQILVEAEFNEENILNNFNY
jgi:hypothetical protein